MKLNFLNKFVFTIKKNAPEILLYSGIGGVIAGTVMACVATTKVKPVIDSHKQCMEMVKIEKENLQEGDYDYSKERRKFVFDTYKDTTFSLIKLYGPSALVMGGSIGCILGSHKILSGRNVALAAAYATITEAYKQYRAEVIEKYGDDIDKELRFGIKAEKNKNSDEKTYKMTAKTPNMPSDYARFFDETNPYWEDNPEYCLMFLKQQQNWANDRLKAKGWIFLNEVYNCLGLPETKAGQIVGWYYNPNDPTRDNFVDFGIYDIRNSAKREFVNGLEKAILLDFNVDGNVLDLMK